VRNDIARSAEHLNSALVFFTTQKHPAKPGAGELRQECRDLKPVDQAVLRLANQRDLAGVASATATGMKSAAKHLDCEWWHLLFHDAVGNPPKLKPAGPDHLHVAAER
jgi:hypothetical protein